MPVALATREPEAPVRPSASAVPRGLSAHAQALWLASVRYRLLADELARDCAGGAVRP